MAKRSKSGRILIYIGEDSRKHMRRVAALEKAASDRANRKAAREAASIKRKAFRKVGGATMQMARKAARDRATLAKREARRRGDNKPTEEYNRQREENARNKPKREKPYHPMGPYATEKYTSYARREERSKRLRATRSSPNTFTCNGYTIKVTIGSNPVPLSCTCPDFTQIGGGRNWSGSNAGPFNPCKHMMAVQPNISSQIICSIIFNCYNGASVFVGTQSGKAYSEIINSPIYFVSVSGSSTIKYVSQQNVNSHIKILADGKSIAAISNAADATFPIGTDYVSLASSSYLRTDVF